MAISANAETLWYIHVELVFVRIGDAEVICINKDESVQRTRLAASLPEAADKVALECGQGKNLLIVGAKQIFRWS